jgi:hypothetical protein
MKPLILLFAFMFTACASHTPRKITVTAVAPAGRMLNAGALRTPEHLKEYRFGRYVDPCDSQAMHEAHPVYRIETSAAWNLAPGNGTGPAPRANTAASTPVTSANDAVVVEANKQRAATRALSEQTATLNQRLSELSPAIKQTKELAEQNIALKREMTAIRERLDKLDEQLRDRGPTIAPPRAKTSAEDKW